MPVDLDALRAELAAYRTPLRSHTSSRRMAERMDYSPRQLGKAFATLEELGEVTAVSQTGGCTTWRIEIGADVEDEQAPT